MDKVIEVLTSFLYDCDTRRVAVAHNPIDHDDDDVIEEADPGGSVLGPSRTRALRGRNKRLRLDSDDEAGKHLYQDAVPTFSVSRKHLLCSVSSIPVLPYRVV